MAGEGVWWAGARHPEDWEPLAWAAQVLAVRLGSVAPGVVPRNPAVVRKAATSGCVPPGHSLWPGEPEGWQFGRNKSSAAQKPREAPTRSLGLHVGLSWVERNQLSKSMAQPPGVPLGFQRWQL